MEHSKHLVDGILHSFSAFVHDVDTLRSQVTDLETIISLRDCYVDLVRTHVLAPTERGKDKGFE